MNEIVSSKEIKCVFNIPGLEGQVSVPCGGEISYHHIQYDSEGGTSADRNRVPVCEKHQYFMHDKGRTRWGDENFACISKPVLAVENGSGSEESGLSDGRVVRICELGRKRFERDKGRKLVSHARIRS